MRFAEGHAGARRIAPEERNGTVAANGDLIAGVGASAGGIEAFEILFRAMPADLGIGFVVIAHLAPERDSMLPEIIGRFTSMPVASAEDGLPVEPDHVYVIAPHTMLTLRKGRLQVRVTAAEHHERNPIDVFLSSLAEDRGERAVGIILSGSGSDGTLGVKALKEHGGLTIAQGTDSTAPRYGGMPSSAIATGVIDLVVPVQDIPAKLADYLRSFDSIELIRAGEEARRDADAQSLRREVCKILQDQVGHDFSGYKERTFLRRIQRRMQVLQISEIGGYLDRLRQDTAEVTRLFRDLLIGVTGFFRDEEAFRTIEKRVVPELFAGKMAGETLRVWVAGCSTGEEVYSLAILVRERMETARVGLKVQIFATDIDDSALQIARAARYPRALLEGVSKDRRDRFLVADGGTFTVAKPVRDLCVFAAHSVIRDTPFSRIDLISCRNLLIYLDGEAQGRVIPAFHYALRSGGFLFLGSSENVTGHGDLFTAFDRKHRIFRRRDVTPSPVHLPLFMPSPRIAAGTTSLQAEPQAGRTNLRRAIETRVLDRFAPPHVVVNRQGEVVHYSARLGKYLEPAVGQPSRQLLTMARAGLRPDLRAAFQEAVEKNRLVLRDHIAVQLDDHVQLLDLAVEPLLTPETEPLFLVLFMDQGAAQSREGPAATPGDPTVEQAEREIRDLRERLQSMIEEYETALEELRSANEELVSLNEELQSTNEELETGKEEIQSVNEELQTVNLELTGKVDELNRANSDLSNLFEGTRIALVFLDRHLVIRSFTPAVTEVFNLIPSDRGRPLTDIATRLDLGPLYQDIAGVADDGPGIERRVSDVGGTSHYLMRVFPYRSVEGVADGLIVTFVDIGSLVEVETQRTLVHELNHRVRNMLAVVSAIAHQTIARSPSPETFGETFMGRIEALARTHGLIAHQEWGDIQLRSIIEAEIEPYAEEGSARLTIKGPSVPLRPKEATALGMIVHELVTNAVKYGALSTAEGRVEVGWRSTPGNPETALDLEWVESGGPPVTTPIARGFGMTLIEHEIRHELHGELKVAFAPGGLRAHITLALGQSR
jgi:two-component system CheB/CheR fusion protein